MTVGRLPIAVVSAMFVAAMTLGLIVIVCNLYPQVGVLEVVTHTSAGLCLAWVAAGRVLHYRRPNLAARPVGRDLTAVLNVAALVLGLTVVIIMVYVAATAALQRTPYLIDYHARWQVHVWRVGLFDLALIAAATLLTWGRTRDYQLLTVCFWILALAGLWLSMQLPAMHRVPIPTGGSYLDMTRWAVPFMFWNALILAGFSALEAGAFHHRRATAWPKALENLTSPPPAWPGFRYSAGIIGVITLILACVHLVSLWATVSAFLAGSAILAMVGRRWEDNLADLGLGLLSIGIVSLPLFNLPTPTYHTAPWFAAVFARVVLGLALATAFWHWLAGVWDQQLDNGRAWTTTGRLIRNTKRVGFLCGATGVLVALQLSFWPRFPEVHCPDDGPARWLWGIVAHTFLVAALLFSACRSRKSTVAWLAIFGLVSLISFSLIRLGDHPVVLWWSRHWPLVMAALAGVSVQLSLAAWRRERWRPFGEPLILFGILIGPAFALAGITLMRFQTMPIWISAATFAALAIGYLFAAFRPGPRAYAVAAVICAAMAVFRLLQMSGSSTL